MPLHVLERIRNEMEEIPGYLGFYYKNLVTGETIAEQADLPMMAASVIKIPIMVECFRRIEAGEIADMLEKMYRGQLVSPEADKDDGITHSIQDNSPVENVVAMYQAAHDYGRY